ASCSGRARYRSCRHQRSRRGHRARHRLARRRARWPAFRRSGRRCASGCSKLVVGAGPATPNEPLTQNPQRKGARHEHGNAVAGFYGRDAGNKLTALLRDHILIAANIVTAAKAGDNAKVTSENKRWHDNANDLAKFLHGANPKHWPEPTLQKALSTHLDQTLSEASNELKGNYAASIKDYDEAMTHML